MKFKNYHQRHRKFSLDRSDKIEKTGEFSTLSKTMRGVMNAYDSFVPDPYILPRKNKLLLGIQLIFILAVLIFSFYYPVKISIPIPFAGRNWDFYLIRDMAILYLFSIIYLLGKHQKIQISSKGIKIKGKTYLWDDIESVKMEKRSKKSKIWYLPQSYTNMKISFKSDKNREKEINIDLSPYSIQDLEYVLHVMQMRNQKKIIRKNKRLEEKFMLESL